MPYVQTYAFQFWIKSDSAKTISFRCDQTYKKLSVSQEWSKFNTVFDVSQICNLYLELPQGQFWIYNAKLETGSFFSDWSPHPEDNTGAYDARFEDIETVLLRHQSSIENTQSIVDKVNQEIINSVSKTTFESAIYGMQDNINERFNNIEDGYGKWYLSVYDKSEFKDTKADDNIDDRERNDMTIFALENSEVNPISEELIEDNTSAMRIDPRGKIVQYLGWAKFSEPTTMTIKCFHTRGTVYLNGMPILSSEEYGKDDIVFNFQEGWNLIEMIGNEGNFSFNQSISKSPKCEIFNCLMGVPSSRSAKIHSQGAYLNIYLDKIVSEVYDTETEVIDGVEHVIQLKSSKIQQTVDMISMIAQFNDNISTFELTPESIESVTRQFIIKDPSGNATIIEGGQIKTGSLTTEMLNSEAIKSINYIPSDNIQTFTDPETGEKTITFTGIPYSKQGTFVDLVNGNIYTPNFMLDNINNNSYFRGTVYATDGVFKGTVYATDGEFSGTVYATDGEFYGTVYATDGVFYGTVYARDGRFSGILESDVARFGPWTLNNEAIYKGDGIFGSNGISNIYLGDMGFSLSDKFIYNTTDGTLRLGIDSLSITGQSLQETILENGHRLYYASATPTLENQPAINWLEDMEMDAHIGDSCIDRSTGKTYEFTQTKAKRFKIKFHANSETNAMDWVDIYFMQNKTVHKVMRRLTGIIGESEIVIPVPDFYVYWHTSVGAALNHWGWAITSVEAVPVTTQISNHYSPVDLPQYAVDGSLAPGTYPSTAHPYTSANADKLWKVRSGLNDELAYAWVEIENVELSEATEAIRQQSIAMEQFLENDWAQLKDGKIETYMQAQDPSKELNDNLVLVDKWETPEEKLSHKGDIWFDTQHGKYYMWSGTAWQLTDVQPPDEVFDQIDGKATIYSGTSFVSGETSSDQPINPHENDLWFKGEDQPILTYVNSQWVEYNKYSTELSDFINGQFNDLVDEVARQADGMAETFYQDTNPAGTNNATWNADQETAQKHTGDMWYSPTSKLYKMWNGTDWQEMKVSPPQELFDRFDGRNRIFSTQINVLPTPPYDVNDFWVNASFTYNGVTYTNDLMRCIVAREKNTTPSGGDWILASKYTDDSKANEAYTKAVKALSYFHYDSTNGLILYDGTCTLPDGILTSADFNNVQSQLKSNIRLTSSGMDIYYGNTKLARYGDTTYFYYYDNNTQKVAAQLGANGLQIKNGSIELGTQGQADYIYIGNKGVSLYNKLLYDSQTNQLKLAVDSIDIGYSDFNSIVSRTETSNQNYYGEGMPVANNFPTQNWSSNKEYYFHLGDVYTDTLTGKRYVYKRNTTFGYKVNFRIMMPNESTDYICFYYYQDNKLYKTNNIYSSGSVVLPTDTFYIYQYSSAVSVPEEEGIVILEGFVVTQIIRYNYQVVYTTASEISSLPKCQMYYYDGTGLYPCTPQPYWYTNETRNLWRVFTKLAEASEYQWEEIIIKDLQDLKNYLHYDASNGLIFYTGTQQLSPTPTTQQLSALGSNLRLGNDGIGIYYGNSKLASYGSDVKFYNTSGLVMASVDSTGFHFSKGNVGDCGFDSNGIFQVSNDNVLNLDASKITTGYLDANRIEANSIFATKLVLGDPTNYFVANEADSKSGISENHPFGASSSSIVQNGYISNTSASMYIVLTGYTMNSFKQNDELYYKFNIKANQSGTGYLAIRFSGRNGYSDDKAYNRTTLYSTAISYDSSTENTVYGTIKIDATAADSGFYSIAFYSFNSAIFYIRKASLRKKVDGNLIVDGSITADKIATGAITIGDISGLSSQLETISNQSTGYTKYITEIDSGGIKIRPSTSSSEYLTINSSGTSLTKVRTDDPTFSTVHTIYNIGDEFTTSTWASHNNINMYVDYYRGFKISPSFGAEFIVDKNLAHESSDVIGGEFDADAHITLVYNKDFQWTTTSGNLTYTYNRVGSVSIYINETSSGLRNDTGKQLIGHDFTNSSMFIGQRNQIDSRTLYIKNRVVNLNALTSDVLANRMLQITYNGDIITGTISGSSKRYKDISRTLTPADVEAFYSVRPVLASYKDAYIGKDHYWHGVKMPMLVAEDIEEVFPNAVKYTDDGQVDNYDDHLIVSVHQQMLIDQKEEIEKLKAEIEELKRLIKEGN